MMKRRNRVSKWVALAVTGVGGIGLVAMVVAMMAVTGVSLVTPDPAFAKFDVSKLTIGGDLRVRGEMRNHAGWGPSDGSLANATRQSNTQFVHQRKDQHASDQKKQRGSHQVLCTASRHILPSPALLEQDVDPFEDSLRAG